MRPIQLFDSFTTSKQKVRRISHINLGLFPDVHTFRPVHSRYEEINTTPRNENIGDLARSEFSTAVLLRIKVFWDVNAVSPGYRFPTFRRNVLPSLFMEQTVITLFVPSKIKALRSSRTSESAKRHSVIAQNNGTLTRHLIKKLLFLQALFPKLFQPIKYGPHRGILVSFTCLWTADA